MTVKQLDKMALAGEDMPTGLDMPHQMYYISVRSLYNSYNDGQITKSQATREKGLIQAQLNSQLEVMRMYEKVVVIYGECMKLSHKARPTIEEYRAIFDVMQREL